MADTIRATERPLSFTGAYQTLQRAQKSNRGAPAYSRWVNRPFGRVLAAAAYRLGMTPNQVTGVSALFTYTGIVLLATVAPSPLLALGVAALLIVGYALDSADGQLARLTKAGRPSGEWLDHVVDMGKICLLHSAVLVSWVRFGTPGSVPEGTLTLLVPLAFLAIAVLSFFGWLLSDLLVRVLRARSAAPPPPAPSGAPALRSLLRVPSDYGLLAVTFAWFAAPLFAITYGLLAVANAAILAAALPTWYRQVRTAEESAS